MIHFLPRQQKKCCDLLRALQGEFQPEGTASMARHHDDEAGLSGMTLVLTKADPKGETSFQFRGYTVIVRQKESSLVDRLLEKDLELKRVLKDRLGLDL